MDITKITGNVVTKTMQDKIQLYYGPPGTWKTTTAVGDIETTLLGAFEIGYKFIPGVKAVNLTSWAGLKDLVRQLNTVEAHAMYKTFVVDTIGLAYKQCIDFICAREGVVSIGKIPYGQGYAMAKNEFEKLIHKIPQMGYGLIMIAHSAELNDEENGTSVKVDIDKRPSSVIKGMADFILYAHKEHKEGSDDPTEMAVYAYSQTVNPNIEVKSRARFFPKKVLFTYDKINEALKNAVEEQDIFFGVTSSDEANFDIYKDTEIDLKALQGEIVTLAEELLKQPQTSPKVNKIISSNIDVKVSLTTKLHIPKLYLIRDQLIDLKKGS